MSEHTLAKQNNDTAFLGHPKGLAYLFFAELWERFSFYGMRALLTLYMVEEIFKSLSNRDYATAAVYASYGSLVYASTVIGGQVSDKILGMRSSIFLGGFLMSIGHFVLAIENDIAFFLALAFIIVGNGFFKPNISTFVGALYEEGDIRKDSGFTIFYMGINIGGWIAPLLCGWLALKYGYHYGFGLAGIGMTTGLIFFWSGIKKNIFGEKGLPPNMEVYEKPIVGIPQKTFIPILALLFVPIIGTYMVKILIKVTSDERKKLIMAILITFFMTLFWGFHELSGSVITLFASRNVALDGFMTAAQTNSLNSMFIIILAIPISLLWGYLSKKNLNPRTPYKFGLGLVLAGASFYILALSEGSADENGMVPFAYLIVMYFVLSIGELFMSPVGLSKITSLSPKRIVAFMMGIWFLSSAYAFQIVGFIGKQLAVESTDANVGGLDTLAIYTDGFMLISQYALGAGLIVIIFSPLMKKLMGDVH